MDRPSQYLKIERAREVLADLLEELGNVFPRTNPRWEVVDIKTENRRYLKLDLNKSPERIPLLIGDIFHNLRSALDHAIFDALKPTNEDESKKTQFPFIHENSSYEKNPHYKYIESKTPKLASLIRNEIGPEKSRNRILWAIHALDIIDKHRSILLSLGNFITTTRIFAWGGEAALQNQTIIPLQNPLLIPVGEISAQPVCVPEFEFNVCLSEHIWFRDKPIEQAITQCIEETGKSVDLIHSCSILPPEASKQD